MLDAVQPRCFHHLSVIFVALLYGSHNMDAKTISDGKTNQITQPNKTKGTEQFHKTRLTQNN